MVELEKIMRFPQKNFREEITDEQERKKIFSEVVREKMKLSRKYKDWLGQNCCLLPEKVHVEKISFTLKKL